MTGTRLTAREFEVLTQLVEWLEEAVAIIEASGLSPQVEALLQRFQTAQDEWLGLVDRTYSGRPHQACAEAMAHGDDIASSLLARSMFGQSELFELLERLEQRS